MVGPAMARRKSRKATKTRRPNSKAINVLNVAQTYMQTAILTRAAFRTTPLEFFTGQQSITSEIWKASPSGGRYLAGTKTTTGYMPITNGTQLTLPELLGMNTAQGLEVPLGGSGHTTTMGAIKDNIALNGGIFQPIAQTVILNVGFTLGKKLLSKQISLTRKGLKMANLDRMVKV